MGNAPSNASNGTDENDPVESVTFPNNPYQRQQQQHHANYSTHHRHSSSPHAFSTQSSSPGPQDSVHPSTIPIAPIPVDSAPRRFPYVKEQLNESPAGSSPFNVTDGHVPTIITWSQGGTNVYVTGTFNNWKQKVRLNKSINDFSTVLNLPPGTHRIKFIVDDEWKCSTELSAATDAEGNLVNFLEVADEEQDELEGPHDSPINESPVGSYTDQIPLYAQSGYSTPASPSGGDILLPLTAITDFSNNNGGRGISNDPPPALPPHLEKVILNNVPSKEDNSVLPVPIMLS
ncbi:galactose metabolism- protein [Modicella reniformis]|uniref:Galactose metabolism- protein n=1 Tax=Modicella reniformis TaxID=1440133 RepID=A0A9P6SPM7_9FUNG|nr:galactose metabolism- protein [Modicella reniformis]